MKTNFTRSLLGSALALPTVASAAFFDFQNWADVNGEQGFNNATPFTMTVDYMTLTATAYENDLNTPSHVYMDKRYHGIIGGMGVCSKLRANAHCGPNTDDNISIDAGNVEILSLNFSQNITNMTLEMGDHGHYDFDGGDFLYRYDSQSWIQASTDADGFVNLLLGGASSKIDFRAVAEGFDNTFYIRNAEVSTGGGFTTAAVVPVPAAAWLLGSGLLAMAGMARRRSA
jgi:hypothetical protein